MDAALASFRPGSGTPADLSKIILESDAFYMASLAAVAIYTGQKEVALDALAANSRSGHFDWTLMWTPIVHPLRNESRFLEIVRALKLPDYWRVAGWGGFCRPKGANDFECAAP
jgi:hypothetical protein